MAMKRTKPVESIVIRRTQTPVKPPPNPDDGLKILGQLVGYTLVAASHQQGFLAGLQQLADDHKELKEFRESTNWKRPKVKKNIP